MNIEYKFLSGIDLQTLFKANETAFSDYLVPIHLTKESFRNHLIQSGVDLSMSVGAFSNNNLIGYTLNGFGEWNGLNTAYNAGTGVIPEYRKLGIGSAMFEFMLPMLKTLGIQQMLLEVLCKNENAIKLYTKLGFVKIRILNFFEQEESIKEPMTDNIVIRQINLFDWKNFQGFGDVKTAWQFSTESFQRSVAKKEILGAFYDDRCIGYSMFYVDSGLISQLAITKEYRRRKIASKLISDMQNRVPSDKNLRFGNVDEGLKDFENFAESANFKKTFSQFEMILQL